MYTHTTYLLSEPSSSSAPQGWLAVEFHVFVRTKLPRYQFPLDSTLNKMEVVKKKTPQPFTHHLCKLSPRKHLRRRRRRN